MRILLTGVSGQVGGALREPLGAIGTVVALDRSQLDLSLPETIPNVLSDVAPELIVNPAAYTAVDRAEGEAEIAHRVNAEAPRQIAVWAAARGIPLVHFSTTMSSMGPASGHGASKILQALFRSTAQAKWLEKWRFAKHRDRTSFSEPHGSTLRKARIFSPQ